MSEYLSDNPGPKTIYQSKGKKDGYRKGKTEKLNHPPNNPGPKCRGEILIYIPWQKRYLFLGQNEKIYNPHPNSVKNTYE